MPRSYTESDLKTLQVLADHCGGALERMRAEQELREAEQRFRELFEDSPDGIFVEDFDGNVLDVNPAGCRLPGASREKLVGANILALVPHERQREVMHDFRRLVSGERTRVEGHHWDYSRPLVVEWLCKPCHAKADQERRAA